MRRARLARALAVFLVLAPLLVGLFLPSQQLVPDGLDELMAVESPELHLNPKHPATEASLWLGYHALLATGYEGKALRPVQLWNAAWMSLALAGLLVLTRAERSFGRLAAFACVPSLAASLHWVSDPYLPYWPPGLALFTWALVLTKARPSRWRFPALVLVLVAMAFFNPILCLGLPLPAWLEAERAKRERGVRSALTSWLLVLILPPLLLFSFLKLQESDKLADGTESHGRNPYGAWTSQSLPQGWQSLEGVFFAPETQRKLVGQENGALIGRALQVLLVVVLAALLAVILRRKRPVQALPALLAAVASALVLLWWDPFQRFFFVLPLWQLFALWPAESEPEPSVEPSFARKSWWAAIPLLLLAALLAANLPPLLQKARTKDPRRLLVEACVQEFRPVDRLFLPLYADYTFKYFGNITTTSLLQPFRRREPGQSTFDKLREMLEEREQAGGKIYFQVPRKAQRWVPLQASQRVELDYSEEDIKARFEWGEEVSCGGTSYRRLVAVR